MPLTSAIDADVMLKRSLGAGWQAQETILRACGRAVGAIPRDAMAAEACATLCRSTGAPTRFWEHKHQTRRGCFPSLVSRGSLIASPVQEPGQRAAHAFQPYISSPEELQRLLQATVTLTSARFPWQPLTYRTLLLSLYGAGLRASEGLRRRCGAVDLCARLLSIWDTKCLKSRIVPMGAALGQALGTYRQARESLPTPTGSRSAFFAVRSGDARSRQQLEKVFRRLRQPAGLGRPAPERWPPRLHDLRHTMAVHRVLAWSRERVDVEARLPLWAAYLGHVHVSGPQIDLPMPPARLAQASWRFERYAAVGKEHAQG